MYLFSETYLKYGKNYYKTEQGFDPLLDRRWTNIQRSSPLGRATVEIWTNISCIYPVKRIIHADGTKPWVKFLQIKSTGDVTRVANFSTLSTLPVCVDTPTF